MTGPETTGLTRTDQATNYPIDGQALHVPSGEIQTGAEYLGRSFRLDLDPGRLRLFIKPARDRTIAAVPRSTGRPRHAFRQLQPLRSS